MLEAPYNHRKIVVVGFYNTLMNGKLRQRFNDRCDVMPNLRVQ